ncbi:DUF1499 domain-containing protein [Alkalimarinus alittae]|uniref:DUF1499 domain-containing protein n=1 Tax=Alkalimarinus alittae TaxID=2961619 RepID=A0ABY6MZU5_9ALTE|nr:DUF1499 domain-containing protein [Alkalimarinus alittae]UZE95349.1 DUF1499 domain-containing protein [Alkalimarinus alittae]
MKIIKLISALALLPLSGCMVFPLEESDPNRSLYWCPPLHNCASTEAVTFVHSIQPFELAMPLEEAWPYIREAVNNLSGTTIEYEYDGYIFAKSRSTVFHFLDYFEVLAVPEENRLNVRSSSLTALTDLFVNYFRTSSFRNELAEKGVIVVKQ